MAKSTRSKVKRHFRAKKREEGVYAATEAARLHRLSMKLKTLAAQEVEDEEMPEGEDRPENAEAERMDDAAGWWSSPDSIVDPPLWFAALGLVDPDDISPERMGRLCEPSTSMPMVVQKGASLSRDPPPRVRNTDKDRSGCPAAFDHLFRSPSY
ncbi:hypothetical protein GSI_00488 [Ganoderma sinense ZZ0214-1]|uniref:DUF2423 domain-containing protein n=1 Tax=Ganoderma sinense ZZ0214-1 TaxID=1077348 RepID=A0A2G8STA6_9APHY|nr:hypothetical protein GSI_00488 [Ganoderma sinense ZZ0214-1]